jgi:hypothetical protein
VGLTLTQVFEAKFPSDSADAAPGTERKIKLLSLQFSPLEYDFELAKATGRPGFASERFQTTVRSDLLPGFGFTVDYSLFDAPVISDTARFSPYAESISASLSIGSGSGGLGVLGRFFTWATGERPDPRPDSARASVSSDATSGGAATASPIIPGASPYTAGRSHPALVDIPTGQGWQASLSLSSNHPRAPRGANVIDVNPETRCEALRTSPTQFDLCVRQQTPANTDYTQTQTTGGGAIFRFPPTTSLSGNMTFNLTRNWAMQWTTMYDLELNEFASQVVSLQRDLKDWRANFGFTQASNGNFAFTFLIALKPAPDLKLDYYRPGYATTPR